MVYLGIQHDSEPFDATVLIWIFIQIFDLSDCEIATPIPTLDKSGFVVQRTVYKY